MLSVVLSSGLKVNWFPQSVPSLPLLSPDQLEGLLLLPGWASSIFIVLAARYAIVGGHMLFQLLSPRKASTVWVGDFSSLIIPCLDVHTSGALFL